VRRKKSHVEPGLATGEQLNIKKVQEDEDDVETRQLAEIQK